jgi:ubiquinone/menaquinone biosynthesis C-methylase UbiE
MTAATTADASGAMSRAGKFWDRVAPKYAKQPIADEAAYEIKLDVTQSYFRPDMEVVELGCGTGSTALIHAPLVKRVRAVDLSEKMLEIARAKAADAGVTNVDFERASVEEFEAADASVDVVMAMSLLHLLRDREAALAKIHAMLKPGGVFVSSTACVADMTNPVKYVLPLARAFGLAPYVGVFREDALVAEIEAAGFRVEHRWKPKKGAAVFLVARKPA